MSEPNRMQSSPKRNHWKTVVIAGSVAAVLLVAAGGVMAYLQDNPTEEVAAEASAPAATLARQVASAPPRTVIEDCNGYAAAADRKEMEIAKDGLIGGAIGAAVGAAGGAIAKGGKGAGKGAGIGAVVGVVGGSLYGLNEENQRTEVARNAYRECMNRQGY